MSSGDVVRVNHLVYEYPGVRALDDVSFSLTRGSVTALVGPNGAGKTTLLRCMAALEQPMDGCIEIDGIDVLEHPRECHRRLGYLSDFFGLYGSLSVHQCLAYAAASQGVPEAQVPDAVQRTAARLDLTLKLHAISNTLSRGQRQRLAIGQALIHRPGLLILDEPASGLDPQARHELATLFRQLREDGMTLIVSSHILAELDEYSTHLLVMRNGQIVESRALASAALTAGRVCIRVEFAAAAATLEHSIQTAIAPLEQVDLLDLEATRVSFVIAEAATSRVALLQALVQAGLPVVEFTSERENLHASYLRTLETPPAGVAQALHPSGVL